VDARAWEYEYAKARLVPRGVRSIDVKSKIMENYTNVENTGFLAF
jgi:hypothetical protein